MRPEAVNEILVDGSVGEGGGQILRTSLSLSLCLGLPFRIKRIRATRSKPGLQPQHLVAVQAARTISQAMVEGDEPGSQEMAFTPGGIIAGNYHFAIGTAGSTSLVLQTILPALMLADAPSRLVLEGGTHNPLAPTFDFLRSTFLPLINRMGPGVTVQLERPGFAPKGGGRVSVKIKPVSSLRSIDIPERGPVYSKYAEVLLAHLPEHIGTRELEVLKQGVGLTDEQACLRVVNDAYGPGNVVSTCIKSKYVTECFSAFGERGVPAEQVAQQVVSDVQRYLKAGVPIGSHLADQLLVPMALAGSGRFLTVQPSAHTLTNIKVIQLFMQLTIDVKKLAHDAWEIHVG